MKLSNWHVSRTNMPKPYHTPKSERDEAKGRLREAEQTLDVDLHVPSAFLRDVAAAVERWENATNCADDFPQELVERRASAQRLLRKLRQELAS